ncbi:hypothetical protein ABG067_001570 [Albugo candida]
MGPMYKCRNTTYMVAMVMIEPFPDYRAINSSNRHGSVIYHIGKLHIAELFGSMISILPSNYNSSSDGDAVEERTEILGSDPSGIKILNNTIGTENYATPDNVQEDVNSKTSERICDQQEQLLPPEPQHACDPSTQDKISRFLSIQKERKQTFEEALHSKKDFANPYILEKVLEYFGIDQHQSNFPLELYDPKSLPVHEYSDQLRFRQKQLRDRRLAREQQEQQLQQTLSASKYARGGRRW